jgi:hypothetical protein
MFAIGQIWQHNESARRIRIKDISNKIIVAEIIATGAPIFITSIELAADYRLIGGAAKMAAAGA